jgi:hypothetical protein
MTTTSRAYPARLACPFEDGAAWIMPDQIRMVDHHAQRAALDALAELFAA